MSRLAEFLSKLEPARPGPYIRPRDSSTLILLDGDARSPRVLMGKRNTRHVFMPGKYVFPGGSVDPGDARVAAANALDADSERRLQARARKINPGRVRAFALAAIRETCEETGLVIGASGAGAEKPLPDAWAPFAKAGCLPNLGAVTFIARAITPLGRPRRFDARFFVARRKAVTAEFPGAVGPQAELVELNWFTIDEALTLDLPNITKVVLAEIEERVKTGFSSATPVPFYRPLRTHTVRELLD